jgi:hypothetical protein
MHYARPPVEEPMIVADLFETQHERSAVEGELAHRIRAAVLRLLQARRAHGTICPSEAAREVAREIGCEWRDLMRPVRYVAGLLVEEGAIETLQNNRRVDLASARGPIRLRLRQPRAP